MTDVNVTVAETNVFTVTVNGVTTYSNNVLWGNITGTLSDQTDLQTSLDAKGAKNLSFLSKSASYSLASTDCGLLVAVDSDATITLPDGLDTGFNCVIENTGAAATITLSAATTLNTKDALTTITSQYGAVSVVHKGSNVWHAWGDLA